MFNFDYNATTDLKPAVLQAMKPYLEQHHGNPSSIHQVGQKARAAVELARDHLAQSLKSDPESLVITASGSEANTLAVRGRLTPPYEDRELIISEIEHSSVLDTAEWLEEQGVTVHRISVDEHGQLNLDELERRLHPDVDLVSIMMVNNETGVRLPIEDVGGLCREHDVLLHTDAVQAFGKVSLSFADLPVDMMTVSAHKVGGPKGAGALLAPKSIALDPLVFGGHQERDRRGGTENVAAVVGFGEAARRSDPGAFERVSCLRQDFENRVADRLEGIRVVGEETRRVANTSGLLIRDVSGEDVVVRLDRAGIAVATGAACTSGSSQPSHVIRAMDLPAGYEAESFVRFSFPPDVTEEEMDLALGQLVETVEDLRDSGLDADLSGPTITEDGAVKLS